MKYFKHFLAILICLFGIIFTLPTIFDEDDLKFLPKSFRQHKVNLGLDLRGGSQLLLAIDINSYLADQYLVYRDEIRTALRKEKIRFKNFIVHTSQDHTGISFSSDDDNDKITKILRKLKGLEVRIIDDAFTVKFTEQMRDELEKNIIEQTIEIIRRRVDETGTKEPTIQAQGKLQILLQVPGLEDPGHLKKLLGKTAKLSLHLVNEEAGLGGVIPQNSTALSMDDESSSRIVIYKEQIVGGDTLVAASAAVREGRPVVEFVFDQHGTRKFADATKNNVGKRIAIVLDSKVISAPMVNGPILGGRGDISGNFTFKTASDLALLLRAGALPAPLKVLEERTVGPSLGEASIEAGTLACCVGIVLVMLFMIIFYGLYGVFSCISLAFNLGFIVALLALFGANLTMAGIAGIVLTVGMAVDANVLIFERIKEEIGKGVNYKISIKRGFERAFATILDSNLTTIIAAVLLYIYGTGSVRGFAVTLIIGILTSMYSAITLTRMMVDAWEKRK